MAKFGNILLHKLRGSGDARGVVTLSLAGLYVAGAQLLLMATVARSLDLVAFGSFVLFLSFATTLDRLLNFQSWQAIIHFGHKALHVEGPPGYLKDLVRKCYVIDFLTAGASAIVAYLLAPAVSHFVGRSGELTTTLQAASVLIFVNQVGVPTGVFRMLRKHGIVAIYRTLAATLTLFCVVLIALSGGDLVDVQFGYIASTAIAVTGLHVVGIWALRNLELPNVEKSANESIGAKVNSRALLSFLFYTNVESASKVLRELDVFLVARYTSEELVGIYRVARRLAESLHLVIDPFHQVLLPRFTRLALDGNLQDARRLTIRGSLAAFTLSLLLLGVFLVVGQLVIVLLFGEQFRESYQIAGLLMLGALLWALSVPLPSMNIALGNPRDNFWIHFLCAFLSIVVTILLTPQIGVLGAVIGYLTFSITWSCSMFYVVRIRVKQAYKLS